MILRYFTVFLLAILLTSCYQVEVQPEPAVVRVGTTGLTKNDIEEALGQSASPEQILDYMRKWSDRELTYQAAIAAGLDKDEIIKRTIENMKKELLSVLFLQQEASKMEAVSVSVDEIEKKYRENPQLYIRKEAAIKTVRMVFNSLPEAWRARDGLTPENFAARAASFMSLDELPSFDDEKFESKSNFTTEIWNSIFSTRVSGITSPLAEGGKYFIYLILDKENVGAALSLSEASESIKLDIMSYKNNNAVRTVSDSLRNRHDYYYDHDYIAYLESFRKNVTETEQETERESEQ